MSDHVKTLERYLDGDFDLKIHELDAAIRALLEENERLRKLDWSLKQENERLRVSLVEHFQREHIEGDGPEIDRWKARIDAALVLHREIQGYCRACSGYSPCSTTKILRGET